MKQAIRIIQSFMVLSYPLGFRRPMPRLLSCPGADEMIYPKVGTTSQYVVRMANDHLGHRRRHDSPPGVT